MSKSKSGFIYIWYDRKHKRFYVGSHWGTPDDGYVCSSRWMRKSYRRRPQDFKRRIIKTIHTSRSDLLKEEERYLSMIKPEEKKIRYYNLHTGGTGHWTAQDNNLSIREKMSKSIKEKWTDPEFRERNIKNSTEGRIKYWQSEKGLKERKKRSQEMLDDPTKYAHLKPMSEEIQQSVIQKRQTPENRERARQTQLKRFEDRPELKMIAGNRMRGTKHKETTKQKMRKHGHCGIGKESRTHYWWRHIKYKYKGMVCDWWDNFDNFLQSMGECPDGKILMRKNIDEKYTPANCYWADKSEQYTKRRPPTKAHKYSYMDITAHKGS